MLLNIPFSEKSEAKFNLSSNRSIINKVENLTDNETILKTIIEEIILKHQLYLYFNELDRELLYEVLKDTNRFQFHIEARKRAQRFDNIFFEAKNRGASIPKNLSILGNINAHKSIYYALYIEYIFKKITCYHNTQVDQYVELIEKSAEKFGLNTPEFQEQISGLLMIFDDVI